EGLGGIDVHVANDGPSPLRARLRVALYQEFQHLIDEAVLDVELEAHGGLTRNVEELLGRFVDVSWAYRFGPPAQDLIAVTLETPGGELLSQAFRFPAGRPLTRESASDLGLDAVIEPSAAGPRLHVTSRRFAYGVRATVPGYTAADDAFGVAPGGERRVALRAVGAATPVDAAATLRALNLSGAVAVRVDADRGGSLRVG
ncbi:MAG TPA: hypothetical protein VGF68_16930, partial [Solirubrobacteraceae bacterium]